MSRQEFERGNRGRILHDHEVQCFCDCLARRQLALETDPGTEPSTVPIQASCSQMEVLTKLYPKTFTLFEYLEGVGLPDLLQAQSQDEGFECFAQTTVLAEIDGTPQLEKPVSIQRSMCQADVITQAVQILNTRGVTANKNVLLFGKSQSSDPWYFAESNQTLLRLPHWEFLLDRVGEVVMLHILVNLSVFLCAPPSCYVQVCGVPIYELIVGRPTPVGNASSSLAFAMTSVCHHTGGWGRLHKKHLLEHLPVSNAGAKKLMSSILSEQKLSKSASLKFTRIRRRFIPMQSLLRDILANHKKTNIVVLLNAHCPTPSRGVTDERSQTLQDLLRETYEPWRVFLFLRGVLVRTVPFRVWGSMHNRRTFFKFVEKFVKLGRTERLDLEQLMRKINVEDCDWTQLEKLAGRPPCPTDAVIQKKMVANLLGWLMSNYVMDLIKTAFYVTETSSCRNKVVYYRTSTWKTLQMMGIEQCVASGIFKPIKNKLAEHLITTNATLGCSSLRFVPKPKGLRPITNMRKPAASKPSVTINRLLEEVCDVLKLLHSQESAALGSSIFSLNGAYEKWKQFVLSYKEKDARPLYFVKVDITQSFDSIPHATLYDIVNELLKLQSQNGAFTTHRYVAVTPRGRRAYHRHTYLNRDGHMSCHQVLLQQAREEIRQNVVLINQVWKTSTTAQNVMALVRKHLGCDIAKFERRYYMRLKGIPQGSSISCLLCSYFYAAMETKCLPPIGQDELMLRLIDDFLLVTPNREKAESFLTTLLNGLPEYGCRTNWNKTLTNFPFVFEDNPIHSIGQSEPFSWCGLLFNTQTLEVSNDFTRYKDVSIRYTMSVDLSENAISKVKSKLIHAMQSKYAGFFLDPEIHSLATIRRNCYEMLLMCAFRFHSLIRVLPHHTKTSVAASSQLLAIIIQLIDKVITLGCPLKTPETKWLGLTAFQVKLDIHQSSYRRLVKLIRKPLRKVSRQIARDDMEALQVASTPTCPQAFKDMKT